MMWAVVTMMKVTSDHLCCIEGVHRMGAQLFDRLLQRRPHAHK
jgi:hypothetical protein